MKFLHIADLHLGKRWNDVSLLEDQIIVLRQLAAEAKAEKADAVLISGDVYQKASPQSEAMAAFNDFVTALVADGAKVFVISGNHDSEQRISYFSELLKKNGVFVSEKFTGTLQRIPLRDEYGDIDIYLLPFIKPAVVRRCFPEANIQTYEDAVRTVLEHSDIRPGIRSVLLCHQFLTGSETSESEERSVGGLDNVDVNLFDFFDYVAMGHIHKPQKVGRESVRYAGSMLKFSFSESLHRKSAVCFELREKGDFTYRLLPIALPHDVREVSGTMETLMQMPYSEDYVRVIVTDEVVPPDARVSVSTVFPNMMKFSVCNSRTKTDTDILAKESIENKSIEQLFCDFFRLQNNDTMPTAAHLAVLGEVLKEMEDRKHETA